MSAARVANVTLSRGAVEMTVPLEATGATAVRPVLRDAGARQKAARTWLRERAGR